MKPCLKYPIPGEEKEVLQLFDDQNRVIRETIVTGEVKETVNYVYDGENLAEKTTRGRGVKETRIYGWRDDILYSELILKNLVPVKKMIYPEPGIRWEVTYRNGEILATVIYQDDIPVETLFGEEPAGAELSYPDKNNTEIPEDNDSGVLELKSETEN